MDIIQKNHLHYDENTQRGNLSCWLGDIATLNSEDIQKIKDLIIFPDKMTLELL